MKLYLAADHAGFALKETLKPVLTGLGHMIEDCGAKTLQEGDDYADYVAPCARKVAHDRGSMGIVIGASGQGEAIAANRISGVRAIVYYGEAAKEQTDAGGEHLSILKGAREHNHANILSLGARFLSEAQAIDAVQRFLSYEVSDDPRHLRRIEKLG